MRVLYIHQHFGTRDGAGGTRSYAFAKKLIERGYNVTMLCGSFAHAKTGLSMPFQDNIRRGQVEGIDVIEIYAPYSNKLNFFQRIKQFLYFAYKASYLVLKLEYDLIYATTTPLTVAFPALCAKFLRKKSYIFEVRDLWPELPKAMGIIKNRLLIFLLGFLEKIAYQKALCCVALSPGIAEGIAKKVSDPSKIFYIPNGCDINDFSEGEKSLLKGFKPTDFICIFTGAHGPANGLDAVLDAAFFLKHQNKHIKFLFVGAGKCKAALIERARIEQLDNCIFWDPVPKNKIPSLLKSVDMGLMVLKNIPAFYFGTSPNKFFDYLVAELPVFNNYPGWLKNLIEEHSCGVCVPPDDPQAFAKALLEIEGDRARLNNMRRNALLLAKTMFDRDHLSEQFIAVIEDSLFRAEGCALYEKS